MTSEPTVWPTLSYDDAPAGIRFLVEAFGFTEHLVVPGEADREVLHAELLWPEGGGVMLGSSGSGDVGATKARSASVYVVTDKPDQVYDRAVAAGATVVREMRDEDYGSRGFTVADPEGNRWSFGTYRGADS
jgi:uncharacterized glyoxalase superfamily protein PhnB